MSVTGLGLDETGRFPQSVPQPEMSLPQPEPLREIIDEMGVRRRLLNFTADYNSDRLVQVSLPDILTVTELKERLATELELSVESFNIVWQDQRIAVSDSVRK